MTTYYASPGATGSGLSENDPIGAIAGAYALTTNGDTIVLLPGIYHEGELVFKHQIHLEGIGRPIIAGSNIFNDWTKGDDGYWRTNADKLRLNANATLLDDPTQETDEARHEEALFRNPIGTKYDENSQVEYTQVFQLSDLGPGKFFVYDENPITLKTPTDKTSGYVDWTPYGAQYVISDDPTGYVFDGVQHIRLLTVAGKETVNSVTFTPKGSTIKGIIFEKAAPHQEWLSNFSYPAETGINDMAGGAVYIGADCDISDCEFRDIQGGGALSASGGDMSRKNDSSYFYYTARVHISRCRFIHNKNNAFGTNGSHESIIEYCHFEQNNIGGYRTSGVGDKSGVGCVKLTHSLNSTFRYNRMIGPLTDSDSPALVYNSGNVLPAYWDDEGMENSHVYGNYITGFPVGLFAEVSESVKYHNNYISGCAQGIRVVGTHGAFVGFNTIVDTANPLYLREDARHGGYNTYSSGAWTTPVTWSVFRGHTWDATDFQIVYNIFAYKNNDGVTNATSTNWAMAVKAAGLPDKDGVTRSTADTMFKNFDGNVYVKNVPAGNAETNLICWQNTSTDTIEFYSTLDSWRTARKGLTSLTKEEHGVVISSDAMLFDSLGRMYAGKSIENTAIVPDEIAADLGVASGTKADPGVNLSVRWDTSYSKTKMAVKAEDSVSIRSQSTAYALTKSQPTLSAESQVGDYAFLAMVGSGVSTDSSWIPSGWTGVFTANSGSNRSGYFAFKKVADPSDTRNVVWSNTNTSWGAKQYGALSVVSGLSEVTLPGSAAVTTTRPTGLTHEGTSRNLIMSATYNTVDLATSANAYPEEWPADALLMGIGSDASTTPWGYFRAGLADAASDVGGATPMIFATFAATLPDTRSEATSNRLHRFFVWKDNKKVPLTVRKV